MGKYIKKFSTHTLYETYINSQDKVLPNVSLCRQEYELHYNPYDYSDDYLTTVALENGTISFNIKEVMETDMITSISYSTDNGETWTTTNNTDGKSGDLVITVNVNKGDKVLWKGDASQLGYYDEDNGPIGSFFSSTCEFDAKGNVMSLHYGDDFKGETTIGEEYAFCFLFSDYDAEKTCGIVNAKNLSLPATTLANYCYTSMFKNCTNLVTTPVLPATTLTTYCYANMFLGCTNLITAPELPATTLAGYCYQRMFQDCVNLTTAPELPVTTLTAGCYRSMFYGCAALTIAPELPATTLTTYCYNYMFQNCTSLNYIKAMFTTTPGIANTGSWVDGVAATGTFVKNSAAQWDVSGVDGIPTGWTVQTASN